MKARLALVCFFLTCILWFADGNCDVADFRVNDDFGMTYQGYSTIATDLEGNFLVCWYDKRNGDNDIYMQLFDHLGNRQGTNRRVNDDPVGAEQLRPSLMKDQTGKFVLAWQDFRVTGYPFNGDIYSQRYNSDGSAASANAKINDDFGVETQGWQDLDADDFGKYVVVWEDNRNGNYDIYAQRYHSSGTKLGANFRVNDDLASAYQHNPKVAVDGDGDFVVVWYDNRSGIDLIMGQRYNSSGVVQGTNFLISDNLANNKCVFPDIACDYNGNFTVVWIDYRNGSYPNNPDVYGRTYWADGTSRSGNFRINTDGSNSSQAEVAVGMDYFGNFITAWRDARQGNNDIFAQYYKPDGVALGGNYRVNTDQGATTQSFPNVTMDGINIYYTWTDERNGSFDVYARITEYGAPAIVINPTSFTFNAELGGSNPATQSLLINNQGYGILNWTASDDQSWLQVTPNSGTALSTATVAVSISGLAYGTYNGRITIADAAGKDSSRTAVVVLNIIAPMLKITPSSISVETELGVPPPADKYLMIENSGSGSLDWSITGLPNWLSLSQSSGTAPSAVDLVFMTDSLSGTGDYVATLTVTSIQAANSPQQVTINLSHSTNVPLIEIDPDTLHFTFAEGTAGLPTQELVIFNTGAGTIDWSIVADATWVTISPTDGFGDGVATIGIQPGILEEGEHYANIIIEDPSAYNSPQTATIHATVLPPPPIICCTPEAMNSVLRDGVVTNVSLELLVQNCGSAGLFWTSSESADWLEMSPVSGGGSDSVSIVINASSLPIGQYSSSISILSAQAGNSPFSLPVSFELLPLDTVVLSSVNAFPGSEVRLELGLHNFLPIDSVGLLIELDDAVFTLDSVESTGRATGKLDYTISTQRSLTMAQVTVESNNVGGVVSSGYGPIALLFLTVSDSASENEYTVSVTATVRDSLENVFTTSSLPGSVLIGAATPVYPIESPIVPEQFNLGQNFPNPFNASTIIPYSLARASDVKLEVMNILGQKVNTLYDGTQNVGNYYAVWYGDDNSGRLLGSGIYFVRLRASDLSLITRVVLLK